MSLEYVPLHVHSDASSDGAGTVTALVKRAKEINLKALALTDHGTLANSVAFHFACVEQEVKPILGMEAYLLYKGKRHHLTLLTLNSTGFDNLITLDNIANAERYVEGYPLMTLDDIYKHRSGLYALTGCIASALYQGTDEDGRNYIYDLVSALGKKYVGIEAMFVGTHDSWSRPLEMKSYFDDKFPLVVTNDTHYPCRDQFHAHQVVTKARKGYTYNSEHLWLKTADEILFEGKKFTDPGIVEMGLRSTLKIADLVEPWSMAAVPSLPSIPEAVDKLREFLQLALKRDIKTKGSASVRKERLHQEWGVLRTKGFLDYVYILWDIVSWARSNGISVGPGRGSGGGSYLLHLLGITSVDPIDFGLLFERFLNPSRSDYPDVDVDFESERRDEVLNYASERWGTVPIATYSCYSHKSAVHDIARELAIPKDLELPAAEGSIDGEAFEEFINDKPDALSAYQTMLGQIRHRGKHAAGVIIPNRPVPIERAGDKLVAAWAEGMNTKDLSKTGIVKYDLLSLSALSMLKKMEEMTSTKVEWGSKYDDQVVLDLFRKGDVSGIFQWSGSEGIRQLTMRINPATFFDLVTCNALYRPGALDAGTAEEYPEYMRNPRKLHPRIDPILEKTYGVICYQEQVMGIVAEMTGGDLGKADIVRRLISKGGVGDPKWEKEVALLHADFIRDSAAQGFEERFVDKIWGEIYNHSRYSFNLSHSTTYTMISYWMAWFKTYHRPQFTVAVLQYDRANAQTYILDAISHDIEVRMPNANHSTLEYGHVWSTDEEKDLLFLPLQDIAYLGERGAQYIVDERRRGGEFKDYADFAKRIPAKVCNNRARQMMERVGAFEYLPGNPKDAIKEYEQIPVRSKYQNQLEVLGYVIPSQQLYEKIEKMASKSAKKNYMSFAGFVQKVTKKKSVHGDYTVYNLSPNGSFWQRGATKYKVGQFVAGSKNNFGSSVDVKSYKLSGE